MLHIVVHDHFSAVCYRDERDVDKKGDKVVIDEFRVILRIYLVNGAWGADIRDWRLFDAE